MEAKPFESRIQDLVYNVDVGVGLLLIKYGLYILFVLLVMAVYAAAQFKGLKVAESMDYAQLGRNLAEQQSFVTRNVRPASIWYLIQNEKIDQQSMVEQHPDLLHAPLYPALLGLWFTLTGQDFSPSFEGPIFPPEYAILTLNLLLVGVTGILLYLLGLRMFERRVAVLAVSLYFLSDLILGDAVSGLPVTLLTCITVAMFLLAAKAAQNFNDEKPAYAWIVPLGLSGLCCIAAFLTRYAAAALLPALILWYMVTLRTRQWKVVAALAVLFFLGISPWLIRNLNISGSLLGLAPYTAFIDSGIYPEDQFERTLALSFEDKEVASALRIKWLKNMARFQFDLLPMMGGGLLGGMFAVSYFYRFARDRVHWLRWCLALFALLLLSIAAFFGENTFRLIHVVCPFALLYATAFFFLLLDRAQIEVRSLRVTVVSLYVLLGSMPFVFALLPPRDSAPYPPYFSPFITYVTEMIKPSEWLCTDMPWATSWYGGKNSLYLPASIDEFYEINDRTKRISGIYFTTLTRGRPYVGSLISGTERSWFPVIEGRIPGDFPLTQGIPLNGQDQVFLTDRPRWE